MKRANKDQTDKEKIAIVDAIVKKGSYLEEALNLNKFIKREKSSFGYKTIKCENEINGYDKVFFETLKNDTAKSFFANYYRFLEIGEFIDGKLDGIGGIYLYDYVNKDEYEFVFLFGRFKRGLPHKTLYFYSSYGDEKNSHIEMDWEMGELITIDKDSRNAKEELWNKSFMKSNLFYYPDSKILLNKKNFKNKEWWGEYKNLYLTNVRPKHNYTKEDKINQINEFIKNGKNLKEKFTEAPIKINPTSIFGYKNFFLDKVFGKFDSYDRGFYKTLKNDSAKEQFANYYRKLEIGEFKNRKLHGLGGRYLYDYQDSPSLVILWGNFINGYLDGKVQYITESDREGIIACLSYWSKGELIKIENRDKEFAKDISKHYFVDPWKALMEPKGVKASEVANYLKDDSDIGEYLKEDYLLDLDDYGYSDAVDWWKEYKQNYNNFKLK